MKQTINLKDLIQQELAKKGLSAKNIPSNVPEEIEIECEPDNAVKTIMVTLIKICLNSPKSIETLLYRPDFETIKASCEKAFSSLTKEEQDIAYADLSARSQKYVPEKSVVLSKESRAVREKIRKSFAGFYKEPSFFSKSDKQILKLKPSEFMMLNSNLRDEKLEIPYSRDDMPWAYDSMIQNKPNPKEMVRELKRVYFEYTKYFKIRT